MSDDDFEPRLGKMGKRGKTPSYKSQIMRAVQLAGLASKLGGRRFTGSRIGRGASVARVIGTGDRHAAFRARRVVVKTRLVKLAGKGIGGAQAHLKYIPRDGVSREGEPGELYAAERDVADGKDFLARSAGDRHQFRLIVSAEDGDQYPDLKPYTRRLMAQMEKDLGTRLEWVAVDHYNTGHPHTHIVLRGVDDRGRDLVIAPEYIGHGLRERASRIATLDLGPRTDLEIQDRQRSEIEAERLTSIDRRLVRDADVAREVQSADADPFQQTLRAGRLQKLGKMGLAENLGRDRWRLAEGIEDALRRIGERGDIIRTMQRDLTERNLDRSPADRVIFDAAVPEAKPIVGRAVTRGLADEHRGTHYLMIDGIDGRTHYVLIGQGDGIEPIRSDAIVRIAPRAAQIREVDRTIAAIAAASRGVYSAEDHRFHDPEVSDEFIAAHERRLEAMRKVMRGVERASDGSWKIGADHLDKVAAFEQRRVRDRPVTIEVLSDVPLERLARANAATWLDRELVSGAPEPLRDAGFGSEVRSAQAARRQWLLAEQLAQERDGQTSYQADLLATLRRRELLRVAGALSNEIGLRFAEAARGEHIEGTFVRRVDLTSGRFALIERSRDFTLVPWRPVLEHQVGKQVSGIMREIGPSWTIGRQRSGPSIT
jgi:type IV secretory pathway VirD2 relaxase